jgi:uncharacterized membrane protein YgdD (TMEM256/DUF423 family)
VEKYDMASRFVTIAATLGFFGVVLGAFGAHGLESTLEKYDHVDTFETAARYQMDHALALLGVAWLTTQFPSKFTVYGGYFLTVGTVIFSGSLYILAIFDLEFMGAIAPIGGAALLAGWGCIAYSAWTQAER